jgi:hypothetical protein
MLAGACAMFLIPVSSPRDGRHTFARVLAGAWQHAT